MQLRAAIPSDALQIADVYLRSRKQRVPFAPLAHVDDDVRTWIRDVLVTSGGVTVATIDNRVVGMLAVSRDGDQGWVDQLYVEPDLVGRGIGSALLEHAKQHLGPPIRLYTFEENERSRRFYEGRGFTAIEFGDGSENEEHVPDVLYEWSADA